MSSWARPNKKRRKNRVENFVDKNGPRDVSSGHESCNHTYTLVIMVTSPRTNYYGRMYFSLSELNSRPQTNVSMLLGWAVENTDMRALQDPPRSFSEDFQEHFFFSLK